jgi:hypothetical protein
MPLADGLPPRAAPLYGELASLVQAHGGRVDFVMYNVGTVVALLSSGAAAVVATTAPLIGAVLSGLAAFLIATTRILKFGSRWSRQLHNRGAYAALIYDLNAVAYLGEDKQNERIDEIYTRMAEIRRDGGSIPGVGDDVG